MSRVITMDSGAPVRSAARQLLARRLRVLRAARGWSQEVLAQLSGNCSLHCSTFPHPSGLPAYTALTSAASNAPNATSASGRSRASLRSTALVHPVRRNLEKLAAAFDLTIGDLLATGHSDYFDR